MARKTEKEKLSEAKVMAHMKASGASLSEIGQKLGVSKTTVGARLKLWDESIGTEIEKSMDLQKGCENIVATVQGILNNDVVARGLGEIAGADMATIQETFKRMYRKKATKSEVFNIFSNLSGFVHGLTVGKEVHKALGLPDRESIVTKDDVAKLVAQKVDEKLSALVATTGPDSKDED